LSAFPMLQQFGLLFRDRLTTIGLSASEITTIINLNSCLTSCAGLGVGINASANSLAVNTYFKEKRRIATGITWTTTGLGPIIFPILIAYFIPEFGVQGTVMIYGGIALNAIVCSLIFHPVKWHIKNNNMDTEITTATGKQCEFCLTSIRKNQSVFSSQYLYNSDHHNMTGYEIIDPGTPMMPNANDGWFSRKPSFCGSAISLTSNRTTRGNSRIPSSQNLLISNKTSYVNLGALSKDGKTMKDGYEKVNTDDKPAVEQPVQGTPQSRKKSSSKSEKREKLKEIFNAIKIDEAPAEDCPSYKAPQDLTKNNFKLLQNKPFINNDTLFINKTSDCTTVQEAALIDDKDDSSTRHGSISKRLSQSEKKQSIFDDLKYLNDNHSGLSTKNQLTPFLVAHFRTYKAVIAASCWIGLNKGLRTVFMALVIPSYVPLSRLPAATGLQLLFAGIFYFVVGPLIGVIRDATNYTVTLHFLNTFTYLTVFFWGLEKYFEVHKEKKKNENVL
ncbi:Monocarboxylate transporter 14, partial [Pseudolycoriella hygida]